MKINKKYIILLLFVFIGTNFVKAHPYYVSICEVDFNRENHSLEISLKLFADDLLLGLEKNGRNKIYLGEKIENQETDTYILEYLKNRLSFKVNQKNVEYTFIGKELEDGVVWIYLEIKNVNQLLTFEVESRILLEVVENQNNIIQVNVGGTIKNLLLDKRTISGVLDFNE
jgi:hypothetical protein